MCAKGQQTWSFRLSDIESVFLGSVTATESIPRVLLVSLRKRLLADGPLGMATSGRGHFRERGNDQEEALTPEKAADCGCAMRD